MNDACGTGRAHVSNVSQYEYRPCPERGRSRASRSEVSPQTKLSMPRLRPCFLRFSGIKTIVACKEAPNGRVGRARRHGEPETPHEVVRRDTGRVQGDHGGRSASKAPGSAPPPNPRSASTR